MSPIRIPELLIRRPLRLLASLYVYCVAMGMLAGLVNGVWRARSFSYSFSGGQITAGDTLFMGSWFMACLWIAWPTVTRAEIAL